MKNSFLKRNLPHFIAVLFFMFISLVFSKPLLEGKKLSTTDLNIYNAISRDNTNYEAATGEIALWNNGLFSGMPDYTVSTPKKENIFQSIYMFLIFGKNAQPLNLIFWYLIGFYILLNVFKINPWISIIGALAFALSSYFFIIIEAGHVTKAISIGFMAPIIAGVYLAFERKRPWIGMLLMTFFLTLQFVAGHIQITYYTGIIVIIYGIFELISAIKEKYLARFIKTLGILAIGPVLALGVNAAYLLTTTEYMPYSIRGKSELSSAVKDGTSGLDKSYATAWSYGIDETFTLLIPNMKGGASSSELGDKSQSYQILSNYFGKQNAKEIVKSMPTYFGDQPFTSGPVYVGAFIVFLFVLGLFVVKGKIKWWLLTCTIVSIVLAWGDNFNFITDLFLNYVPGYNRFRVVAMILVIAEFTIPFLAILGLVEIFKNNIDRKKLLNYFYIALGTTGIITMIFIISPSITGLDSVNKPEARMINSYSSAFDVDPNHPQYANSKQMKEEFKTSLQNAIYHDRASMVRNDALRSLVFIIIGASIIYLYIQNKIKLNFALIAIGVIILIDMLPIDKRYLNDNNFISNKKHKNPYEKTKADEFILKDTDIHYRVCNIAVSTFNDGSTSYFHKSIGGYSGAKIRRYQELHDSIMWREMQMASYLINAGYQNGFDESAVQSLFTAQSKTPILNMLNAKYIIYDPKYIPMENHEALGNAWFVNSYKLVENPDDEISTLNNIDPANEAVISKQFQKQLEGFKFNIDSLATIKLKKITPNYAIYESKTSSEQLAVFSEIYYPKGWKITIDDNEVEQLRANYVLRAIRVPAGEHIIKFNFEPESYKLGVLISYICSIILLFMVFLAVYIEYKKNKILNK